MIRSPLRYPGGKSRAVERIAALIPAFDEFREPFLGGGSLFVYLKQKFPKNVFWVNDLNPELFLFWKHSQQDVGRVIGQVIEWRHQYKIGKELHTFLNENLPQFDDWQRAAAFFVYNRITFSGTSLSGGYSDRAFHERFTDSSIERLRELGGILFNATITNSDYEELVKKDGKSVFIFLDPPYYSASKSKLYGKNGDLHTGFDHERFAATMRKCKHPFLITYDDSKYIRSLFSFANIVHWNLTYGMRNVTEASDQIGKELFISNYRLNGLVPGESLKKRLLFE